MGLCLSTLREQKGLKKVKLFLSTVREHKAVQRVDLCVSSLREHQPFQRAKLNWLLGRKELAPVPRKLRKFFPKGIEHDGRFPAFVNIFSSIQFDKLPEYMLSLRNNGPLPHWSDLSEKKRNALLPTIQAPALFGSLNVAFVIKFPDGVRWLLKISANGYPNQFSQHEAESLRSEALTMQLLKRETTIPLPEVYAFDSSFDNPINAPFIAMGFVEGVLLAEIWFDDEVPSDVLEKRRETSLREVALVMHELNKFTMTQGGAPRFDDQGNPTGVGPTKELDMGTMWDEDIDQPIYRKTGPFPDFQSYLRSLFPFRPTSVPADGWRKIFYHLLDWIPECVPNEQSFVLTHPDFNLQNILVDSEGHVTSFIDWDGVSYVPRALGNERYPDWLMCDWNPFIYTYYSTPDPEYDACNANNSPQELSRYRAMYEQFVLETSSPSASSCSSKESSPSREHVTPPSSVSSDSVENTTSVTRNSLILGTLKYNANFRHGESAFVYRLYDRILSVQTDGKYSDRKELSIMDRRNLFLLTDMLEKEGKVKEEEENKEKVDEVDEHKIDDDDDDEGDKVDKVDKVDEEDKGDEVEAGEDEVKEIEDNEEGKKEDDADDEDEDEDDGDQDESDTHSVALSYEPESEVDPDEVLKKRLDWTKEGFQKLFSFS